ncbi:MAG TPA: hypothetical protein PL007_08745 [Thermomonas sp.]|uniref:hypothetical protein n=1 Tax=Dokdonella sp. TaxID=2291710 RepID=UPI002C5D8209|nr:hypothetical protein [Xanthomonadales bacterium]MBK7210010.1 hypothetical protein [Xanthomonadales bacterium]HQY50436.1 hypothetical protein [Thermomonas sp.]HRA63954.1 hypothetical protein [Burkholderiaceae bacterium]
MSTVTTIGALLLSLFGATAAHAGGRADICYTAWSASAPPPTTASVFVCPQAGTATLGQLANAGWIMVKLLPMARFENDTYQTSEQLLIRQEWIYRNGFD